MKDKKMKEFESWFEGRPGGTCNGLDASQKVTELKNDAQLLTCGALLIQNSHSELVMSAKNTF